MATTSREQLDAALDAADLRVLTVCLFHLTGDDRWLADDVRPRRDVRLIADPLAGYDDDTATMIRGAVRDWVERSDGTPSVVDPGPERFGEMLSFCLGETVPPEYVPLVRREFGFEPEAAPRTLDRGVTERPSVLIVGAGASGICLARQLDRAGIDWRMVEKNDELGGTWHENRYPGVGVDTPNHFYSYSWAPNPDWSRFFSGGDELRRYLIGVAADADVAGRITTGARVTRADWDADGQRWHVTVETSSGTIVETADVLVTATGHFNRPVTPTLPGADRFDGRVAHTARWPADLDLAGRRVGVVGTGASSMQLVPTIAGTTEHVTVFQRTAQWSRPVPEYRREVDPAANWLFAHLPMYDRWYRFAQMWRYGDGLLRFLRKDPDWEQPERSLNRVNERHRREMEDFIRSELEGRDDLIEKCMPDYPPFAKRILIDNGWFSTMRRPDVELVTEPIAEVTPTGIRTTDGVDHELDVLVYATGFDVTSLASHIDIRGVDGDRLADDWADENPRALLGIAVPRFPNLFVMYGPNTNMGHGGSGIFLAETQTEYIVDRVCDMAEAGFGAIECLPERRDEYTEQIDQLHDELIWTHPATGTYYRNSHGQVRSPMPFRLVDYWTMTRERGLEDFTTTPRAAEPGKED